MPFTIIPYALPSIVVALIFYLFSPIVLLQVLIPTILSVLVIAPFTKENITRRTKERNTALYRDSVILFFNLAFIGSFCSLLGLSYMYDPWVLGTNIALFSIFLGMMYIGFTFNKHATSYWKCSYYIETRVVVISMLSPAMSMPFFLYLYIWKPGAIFG